ncbi:MAG: tripartite tricarboxylate transporter substrate binding protein [Proteobacteria bacterium]|nr:tripartite tricarboxylate transporter substrate binding protein [Pseudomonadota bacterium]
MPNLIKRVAITMTIVLLASPAAAQYPTKPLHVVVPMQAGSVTDTITRIISTRLTQTLGQQLIIETKPGADGAIAGEFVTRAAPDGYTIMIGTNSPLTGVPALRKAPPYDTLADFTPISFIGKFTHFLVVHPGVPAKSVAELVAYARANPGKLNLATGHTAALIYGAQLKTLAQVDMVQIPYKGEPAAVVDLLSGRVQVMFSSPTTMLTHVREGRLRALGVVLNQRSPLLPDVPTMAEAGYPGFANVSWAAMVGPAKMPREIVNRLNREINAVLKEPGIREQLERHAIEIAGSTPEELTGILKSQLDVWSRSLSEAGVKPE